MREKRRENSKEREIRTGKIRRRKSVRMNSKWSSSGKNNEWKSREESEDDKRL